MTEHTPPSRPSDGAEDLCFVCGGPFSAERAALGYGYCMKPECVKQGKKPLQFIAVAQNKAADAINILTPEAEEETRTKLRDVRRAVVQGVRSAVEPKPVVAPRPAETPRAPRKRQKLPGTPKQQRLVHIYREQGDRVPVIAEKTKLSQWAVNKILQSKMRRTL